MKQHLWWIGLALTVIGAYSYTLIASSTSVVPWIVSTVLTVAGGIILIAAYLAYHRPKSN